MKKLLILLSALAAAFMLLSCGVTEQTPHPNTIFATDSYPAESTEPTDALSALRADMLPPVMAVADLGFPTLSEDFEIMAYLLDAYPRWMAEHDFIQAIPQQRIVNTCGSDAWAQLLCIVPKDPAASVSVEVVRYLDAAPYTQTEVVYRSETGEPILLLADLSDSVSVSVVVTDSQGRGLSWMPYWETYQVIPEGSYPGALVMYFTPESEITAYSQCLDDGWTVPDDTFLADHYFQSDYHYGLELIYNPGERYDGEAAIYELDGSGNETLTYSGYWRYTEGTLHLDMASDFDSSIGFRGEFPVLLSPYAQGYLCIFRTEDGLGLPQFYDDLEADVWQDLGSGPLSAYDYALFQGWQVPEPADLSDSILSSQNGYALDLQDGGVARIYEVGEDGVYNQSHSGSWDYVGSMLQLSLAPLHPGGTAVEDAFPVLILEGEIWIGRAESGLGLPHFYPDQSTDILTPAVG